MRVSDLIRDCVAYIGAPRIDGSVDIGGTGFFVAKPAPGYAVTAVTRSRLHMTGMFMYFVTARHVLDKIRDKGAENAAIRVNLKAGGCEYLYCPLNAFTAHPDPTVDLVIVHADNELPQTTVVPWSMFGGVVTNAFVERENIGVGTPISIAGLFTHHGGRDKNLPIVRSGNIAAMAEEKVLTKMGLMDALLIEARSIGGLSGSPVFTNLALERMYDPPIQSFEDVSGTLLLGIVHGHFDEGPEGERVNVGIGIVTPATKLVELLHLPGVLAEEELVLERQRARDLLVPRP